MPTTQDSMQQQQRKLGFARWKMPWASPPIVLAMMMTAQHAVPTLSSNFAVAPREDHEASCPPCDLYFSKLDVSPSSNGTFSQNVVIVERGEPKSGTGLALEWGVGALSHACKHLQNFFGRKSCAVRIGMGPVGEGKEVKQSLFIFEPSKGVPDARCPCGEIERVKIEAKSIGKHIFPLQGRCAWAHIRGFDIDKKTACTFPDGSKPKNFKALRDCVDESRCRLAARGEQEMVVFRDPRAVAVSTYYYRGVYKDVDTSGQPRVTVDDFALSILPILCQWTSVRHILFEEYLAEQSVVFWYEDMLTGPVEFHRKWLALVGLQLPGTELEIAVEKALRGDFNFRPKGLDPRPGSSIQQKNSTTFRDELKTETLQQMDPILSLWLPPVFLSKLGIMNVRV